MRRLSSIAGLRALVGSSLGVSEWHDITQERVSAFASATEDFEAIHLTPAAARAQGYPDSIAHGLYVLGLGPMMSGQVYSIANFSNAVNYGYNRVRFMSPTLVGSRIRLRLGLNVATQFEGGTQFTFQQTFELAEQVKPACVAESLSRFYD